MYVVKRSAFIPHGQSADLQSVVRGYKEGSCPTVKAAESGGGTFIQAYFGAQKFLYSVLAKMPCMLLFSGHCWGVTWGTVDVAREALLLDRTHPIP